MKKYDKQELGYFSLTEQELQGGDDYEQQIDEEEAGIKNVRARQDAHSKRRATATDTAIETKNARVPNGLNPTEITIGTVLQTTADQWLNGVLIPRDTLLTVVAPPQKIRGIKREDNDEQQYIVKGKALLSSGQVAELRINLWDCKLPDKDVNEELEW